MSTLAKRRISPPITAQFGQNNDGTVWIAFGLEGAVPSPVAFPGTLQQAMAFAGQVNAIPLACAAMLAVLDTCRSDENDVALPTSVVEQLRDALHGMGVRA